MLEEITAYISPELMILIPVLYALGIILKRAGFIPDKFIPLILGGVGILICWIYEIMMLGFGLEAVFCGIVQGILVAGVTVYGNQIVKQIKKAE